MLVVNRREFLRGAGVGAASLFFSQLNAQAVRFDASQDENLFSSYYNNEKYRPQFHFTPKRNWMNDPNGLVYYKGEYHLFFQHNPKGKNWGNMTWGHAVSEDLVHWLQLPDAIEPDELGTIFSGSAVVDWNNTAGLQTGKGKVIVAIYTSAGDFAPDKKPFTQSIAYSNDCGRTWKKYEKNPVLGHIAGQNRDPKVIWHKSSRRWVMALYLNDNDYTLFSSKNLKDWSRLCDINLAGASECPDIFELAVDGNAKNRRWVFWAANGSYVLGTFDGEKFNKESDILLAETGANFYAAQTFSNIPETDGRRIQIAWMRGGRYPDMPFNQQMSFPCELTLRTFPEGIRLCRQPVREIEKIQSKEYRWKNKTLKTGDNLLCDISGELFHVCAEIEPVNAAEFGIKVHGEAVNYNVSKNELSCLGRKASLKPLSGKIRLEILIDRTSIEVFCDDGRVSMSSCFLPKPEEKTLEIYTKDGEVKITSLRVYKLRSIWQKTII